MTLTARHLRHAKPRCGHGHYEFGTDTNPHLQLIEAFGQLDEVI